MNDFNNPVLRKLPAHLGAYLVDQHYEHYSPIDQAVWRYVMRQNYRYLKDIAYYPYIPGLQKAGISVERIPDLQTMNDHLKKLGWGAVTVNGFIPPSAFMEFQACRVLVIAADIRQLEHIDYTPAPDIIHESAGHAPIIAEPDYAEYLRYFGEVGTKAILSQKDIQLYEAIRKLSVLKEQAGVSKNSIAKAQAELEELQRNMGQPSEMALLSRLHWWTVEYGLIGNLDDPKIYGAGLLSSIGESASCMQPSVKKLPYSIEAVNYSYDITQPQPQLFVTPDFDELTNVLEQFADSMAFRRGGLLGLLKAVESGAVCTAVFSSGLQVSGIFQDVDVYGLVYIQTKGPTALAIDGKTLPDQGPTAHANGIGSPVGRLKGYSFSLEDFTVGDLRNLGLERGQNGRLEFESGISVEGSVISTEFHKEKLILINFSHCTVRDERSGQRLFDPSMGKYTLCVGEEISSVFFGVADKTIAYSLEELLEAAATSPSGGLQTGREQPDSSQGNHLRTGPSRPSPREHRPSGPVNDQLAALYQKVRDVRERHLDATALPKLWKELKAHFPTDWLCATEILEILEKDEIFASLAAEIAAFLKEKGRKIATG